MKTSSGSACERSHARWMANSSRSGPRPTSCASANHASGPRCGSAGEARQGLVADDLARVEGDDRLERDLELAAVITAPDPRTLREARLVGAAGGVDLPDRSLSSAPAHHAVEVRLARRGARAAPRRAVEREPRAARSRRRPRSIASPSLVVLGGVGEHARAGRAVEDRRTAASPPPGSCTSTRATSGWAAAANSRAWLAHRASRRARSRRACRGRRSSAASDNSWSSATKTRTGTPAMGRMSPGVRREVNRERAASDEMRGSAQFLRC